MENSFSANAFHKGVNAFEMLWPTASNKTLNYSELLKYYLLAGNKEVKNMQIRS